MLDGDCKLGFFGLGRSNLSLLSLLSEGRRVTIRSDTAVNKSALPKGPVYERILEGAAARENIDEDILVFSPSVRRDGPQLAEARARGVKFTSDAELFFGENERPIFAVTGSDGKSTTATLTSLLLKEAGISNALIGNVGNPMTAALGSSDSFVCELSSFMLTYVRPRVKRAAITNITPNHLDWHNSYEEYRAVKLRLLENAEESVLTDEFRSAYAIVSTERAFSELKKTHNAHIFITKEDGYILRNGERLIPISIIKRNEKHNIQNLMTAIGLTDGYTGKREIATVAEKFSGLAHRCRLITTKNGVECYDSSIDSTPKRTAATLSSLGRRTVIILGGRSKGLDYSELFLPLKKYAEAVILTGENTDEIAHAVSGAAYTEKQEDFQSAVLRGYELAKDVGTLLLSPASTSYDRFKNYEERGLIFKEILENM